MIPPLRKLVERYPNDLHPHHDPQPLGNAGGLSGARLWRYRTSSGLVVAKAWPSGRTLDEVLTIHRWVRRGEILGFLPIARDGRDGLSAQLIDERVWEVAPWMPGSADLASPPSREHVNAAFAALGAVHLAWGPGQGPEFSPGLAMRVRELESLPRDLDAWTFAVRAFPSDDLAVMALRWIDAARRVGPILSPRMRLWASQPVRIQPVLRDARSDHFLFTGDRLTGLVDFGAMGIDAVAADLARLISDWEGLEGVLLRDAMASYEATRSLDPAERSLIDAFGLSSAVLGGARWIRWHFVEGRRFDDSQSVARGLRRAVEKITSLTTRVIAGEIS